MLRADVEPAARVGPFAARPVRVVLDAIALDIVEIEGLADEMVSRAGERQSLVERSPHEATELLLAGQKDRKVVEARGVPRPFATPGKREEPQQRRTIRTENGMVIAAADSAQTEPLVEVDRTLQVENLQLHR